MFQTAIKGRPLHPLNHLVFGKNITVKKKNIVFLAFFPFWPFTANNLYNLPRELQVASRHKVFCRDLIFLARFEAFNTKKRPFYHQ
jgi:hypothetical protein